MDEQPRDLSIGEEAFNIFEKRIASEVAIENAQLEKNIKLRSNVYDHINNVELRTSDNEIVIPFGGMDTAEDDPSGRHILCNRLPGPVYLDIPLIKLRRDEGTKLCVSNQCAGNFPALLSNPEVKDIDIEDKSFHVRILDSKGTTALFGKVTNLSDMDFQSVINEEGGDAMGFMLQMGKEWNFSSPDAVFTPTHVTILILDNGHPGVLTSMHYIQEPVASMEYGNGIDDMVSEMQRKLVFSVTKNSHNYVLMEKRRKLKYKQKQLDALQDIIESVEISDDEGNECSKLMSNGIRLGDGGLSIFLPPSKCDFVGVNNLHKIKLTVSGVCLRKAEASFTPYRDGVGSQVYIKYDTGITLIGHLDMGGLSGPELSVMNEDVLPSILQNVVENRQVRLQFPHDAFCLRSLHFDESCVSVLGKIHGLLPTRMLNLS